MPKRKKKAAPPKSPPTGLDKQLNFNAASRKLGRLQREIAETNFQLRNYKLARFDKDHASFDLDLADMLNETLSMATLQLHISRQVLWRLVRDADDRALAKIK